ncbi:MAG: ATP-binding protein [Solirubrobacterales bacterium]
MSISLPARPESVGIARREAAGLGERMGLSRERIDDLRTVVSEACANAAQHAYQGGEGAFALRAVPRRDWIAITVTDQGGGVRPQPASERSSGRLGLLVMAALASKFEISARPSGGTRLSLRFPVD